MTVGEQVQPLLNRQLNLFCALRGIDPASMQYWSYTNGNGSCELNMHMQSLAYAITATDCMSVCRLAHHHFKWPAELVGMHLHRKSWRARFAACARLGDRVSDI